MKKMAAVLFTVLFAGVMSCSGSSSTTEYCDEACTIWTNCIGWNFDQCMNECVSEGDWDQGYLMCIENQGCGNLLACE